MSDLSDDYDYLIHDEEREDLTPRRRRAMPNISTPEEAFGATGSKRPPPDNNGYYKGLLDDIDNHGSRLTSWELDFVDDMLRFLEDKRDEGRDLTDAQCEKIEEIYDQKL